MNTITMQEWRDNSAELANPRGTVFGLMPKHLRDLLMKLPPDQIQVFHKGKWHYFRGTVEHLACRVNPDWSGPVEEHLPETDGNLRNPFTLKALQNEKRIPLRLAPESWKKDFLAACRADAVWGVGDSGCTSDGTPRFDSTNDPYYIDPSWLFPPLPMAPKYVDVVPTCFVNWSVMPPGRGKFSLSSVPSLKNFAGFVYRRSQGLAQWDPAVVEKVTTELEFDMADGHPKLMVPAAVRFRVS